MWNGVVSERKMSKKLRLIKRVREHYTRDNVCCGFECCGGSCKTSNKNLVFAIPAAEVLVRYRALFRSDYIMAIICQSVLEEMPKNEERNIRDIVKCGEHLIFCNNFCSSTYGRGLDGVLQFYENHLPQHKFIILDLENIRSYNEYVEDDITDLLELVEEREETNYERYRENLEIMWKRGELYRGSLQVDMYDFYSGYVLSSGTKILIVGKANMNRAMHGDEVYVEVIGESEENAISFENDSATTRDAVGPSKEHRMFGKVVGIHQRKCRKVIGTISKRSLHGSGTQNVLVIPIDRKLPAVRIRTSQVEELINRRLCIDIDGWETTSNYPIGHYYKRMDVVGNKDGEEEAILMVNGIDYHGLEWSEILKELSISESSFNLARAYEEVRDGTREDFRNLDVLSIDPDGCTDIDDTLHCRLLPNGRLEVGVHIADVTLYIEKDSPLDKIAADRGTTIYLPGRRIDMLPSVLSTDICSLVEGKDRAAFSVVWEMSKDARVSRTHFCRSLIRSRRSLSYEEADRIIRKVDSSSKEIYDTLVSLCQISKILRQRRFDNGSLDLSTRELVFGEAGLETKKGLQTNFLVEEFMLLANITVATFTHYYCPETSLLRRHPPPSALASTELDVSSSKSLNDSLGRLEETRRDIVKKSLIKSMNQAVYFIPKDTSDFRHYGLSIPIYTHFTSPIRRYADIVVHRILDHILHSPQPVDVSIDGLGLISFCSRKRDSVWMEDTFIDETTCKNLNLRHRSAQRASWECGKLAVYLILREIEPITNAHVVSIRNNGVILYIPEYDIEEAVSSEGTFEVFQPMKVRIIRDDESFFMRGRFSIEIIN